MNLGVVNAATSGKGGYKAPDDGAYLGYIDTVEKRTAKSGNEYLNLKIKLTDECGDSKGCMFAMLFDSDKQYLQYQAGRIISAVGIPMEGEMDLDEVGTLLEKQELVVVIKTEKNDGYKDRIVIDWDQFDGCQSVDRWDDVCAAVNHGVPCESYLGQGLWADEIPTLEESGALPTDTEDRTFI